MHFCQCGFCKKNLTYSDKGYGHRIVLSSELMSPLPGTHQGSPTTTPELEKTMKFCGLDCLFNWMVKGEQQGVADGPHEDAQQELFRDLVRDWTRYMEG